MMKQTAILFGAKRSKGVLDNGNAFDSTKVYIQVPMNDSDDTAGFGVTEYTWGDSTNFYKIKDLQYPVQVELSLDLVTNGKTSKLVVTDVKPLKVA